MTVEQWSAFNAYHARNRESAERLRRFVVLCIGSGAVGSHTVALLAQAGCSVIVFDRDILDEANLTRHYVADRTYLGESKAHALARKLRTEIPSLQSVRGIKGDLEALSDEELRTLLRGASLVLAASGRDAVDHRLNAAARDLRLPLVVPSLWGDNEVRVLGDIHVVAWHATTRRGACFACLRPQATDAPAPAEAQRGSAAEVVRVASHTAEIILGFFLTDSLQHQALWRQLDRGACYFIAPRWPPSLRAVITRPRRGCPVCSTVATTDTRGRSGDVANWSVADLCFGAGLAGTALCQQFVPGFDAAATLALVVLTGVWWRGRLPSYLDVSERVRRWWNGR